MGKIAAELDGSWLRNGIIRTYEPPTLHDFPIMQNVEQSPHTSDRYIESVPEAERPCFIGLL